MGRANVRFSPSSIWNPTVHEEEPVFRIATGFFVLLHGLVHFWYVVLSQRLVKFQPEMGWTSESWVLSGPLSESVTRSLATGLYALAALAFVVSAAGFLGRSDWWRPAMSISAVFSAVTILMYWDGNMAMLVEKGLAGLLINVGIVAVLFLVA
jgi:hypothetical protein